eukprot:GFKZ01006115.1.p1 GENE.GFKZ01006115.1~~GFKZ01006115.1.p1  ORF type:complete len:320 (-),score=35.36 GFKZ01006115.1:497-1456(-)
MATVLDERLLAITAIITIAFQFTFFLITYALRFDKVTDFAGTTNFLILTVVTLTIGGTYNPRQVVVSTCVFAWGARLCAFLLYRIILWGEDRRFDDKRNNIVNLAGFWILQAIWVWTVSLPVTILNSKSDDTVVALNASDYVGWSLFGFGVVLEAVADQQKLRYKQTEASRGRWTDVGVWSWSRHPNFFGEMIVWWGLYISARNVFVGAEHVAVVGPLFITLLLMFVSGVPILERSMDERYGRREEFKRYKKRTSVLFLIPPALYERVPEVVKTTVLLDFKLYNPGPKSEQDELVGVGKAHEGTELVTESGMENDKAQV